MISSQMVLEVSCSVLKHHGIKACRGRVGKAAQFLNLGTRWHHADSPGHIRVLTFV